MLSDTSGSDDLKPDNAVAWLISWRIVLGFGIGGDYPMSASVATDRSKVRRRGVMLAYIFSNQGWGSFVGAIVVMFVLLCYKHVMETKGEVSKVDGGMRPYVHSFPGSCLRFIQYGVSLWGFL